MGKGENEPNPIGWAISTSQSYIFVYVAYQY